MVKLLFVTFYIGKNLDKLLKPRVLFDEEVEMSHKRKNVPELSLLTEIRSCKWQKILESITHLLKKYLKRL